ncbi:MULTISPECIES: nucleotide exchange factor GrpE [Heyndrickxia]|uniref:nucleotide exchange factor GrpE n=1 Tax=Heyndrickxia TaxID=2837504 RepID=UPI002DBD8491|nr:nucleotide exchange factor GrpE [Weizmannia sp. CD-2023]MEC2304212.1 nucleotide exchange factor GrpE [Weizmannia sp. CD-2023]MEC2340375.1 nucleotide exchange factor GrpE [Weizmannia sp. CD-2023]
MADEQNKRASEEVKDEQKRASDEVKEGQIESIFAEEKDTENQQAPPEGEGNGAEKVEKPETENAAEELKKAKEEIEKLRNELDQAENRYLRLRADFDNYRRRVTLDREAAEKYRAQDLIVNLLPALDNFERALSMAEKNEHTAQLLDGMEMVYRSILEALKKEGAEPIEALGKEFDPHYHQAIMQGQEEGTASNVVIEEFQKGYILKDRVIRPSMVKVNE